MNFALALITLTSSFCTMSYSMLMATLMMDFTGEEILTQCLTMGPYLFGLGLGSLYGDVIREDRRLKMIWGLEWLSVLILPVVPLLQILVVFLFLHLSPYGMKMEGSEALTILLTANGILSLLTGMLGGAQLPMILKQNLRFSEEKILAINYMGPLFAGISIVVMSSFAFPIALQIFLTGIVQLAGLFFLARQFPRASRSLVALLGLTGILFGTCSMIARLEEMTIKSAYLGIKTRPLDFLSPANMLRVIHSFGTLERVRTPYQTIDLFIEPPQLEYSVPGNASVYLNRKPQFDLFSVGVYHQSMVFGAINLLKKNPRHVLILGAGDGLLLKEFRALDKDINVTMVELDEKMLEWSRTNEVVSQLNEHALDHLPANINLIVGDGVSFLRNYSGTKFDLILVDFPFPNGHDLAKLYSLEFYRLIKRTVSESGVVILDLPLYATPDGSLSSESKTIVHTLNASGFGQPLLFGPYASFIALAADEKKLRFDYERLPDGLAMATYLNLVEIFPDATTPEKMKNIKVNTMFWPRGL